MKNLNFSSRKFRGGAYATVLSLVVVLLVLGVNLLAGRLFGTKDLTNLGTYSLSEETMEYLKQIDTPIELYYISESGEESLVLSQAAELFAKYGKHISLIYKDPVQYPQFVYNYTDVGSKINNNSIIVVNAEEPDRYAYIDREEMCIYSLDGDDMSKKVLSGYDVELELVKAMVSVTDSGRSKVYFTVGHGEFLTNPQASEHAVSDTLADLLSLNSYQVKYLDLAKVDAIPKDCDVLCIGGATSDLTENEAMVLREYITNGGNVMLLLYYTGEPLPQVQQFMQYYGMEIGVGLLNEGDSEYTENGNKNYVLTKYEGKNVQWALSSGVTVTGSTRDTLQVEALYQTTDKAFLKENIESQEWQEGDPMGPFALLARATETYQGNTGSLYVFNTCFFLADKCIGGNVRYGNRQLFLSILGEVTGTDSSLSIPTTSAYEEGLTMTTKEKNTVLAISVAVPAMFLLLGIAVFVRRRA